MSSRLQHLHALEVLDSRGNPTLEVIAITDTGAIGKAAVPSGASTGEHEAVELRDGDHKRYSGKGVLKAIHNVNGPLLTLLKGQKIDQQEKIDQRMIEADGTPNKSKLGANAILGVSLAIAKAAAADQKIPLFRYLAHGKEPLLPCPMMNILNGGVHADNGLDIQEFMIRPIGAPSIEEAIRWGAEVFHALKGILKKKGHVTSVGDEGGFAPRLTSNEEALDFILEAIVKAGYDCQTHFSLALDCAASEFYDSHTHLYAKTRTSQQQVDYLARLCTLYPIDSIEDGLDQNDWAGWKNLTERVGKKVQVVGDDLFVTNTHFLKKGIVQHAANAILIKVNQIGTLTETLQAIHLAQAHSFGTILSHRSGETEDTTIADIAVATRAGQIKTGSLSRSDRIAKYNRLLEISDSLKNT